MKLKNLLQENVQLDRVNNSRDIIIAGITNVIDVTHNVNLSSQFLKNLPAKFGKIGGSFYCNYNELTSLEGCPDEVDNDFVCNNNQLTSLGGSPSKIGYDFICSFNQLLTLEGCPSKVGGDFMCHENNLTSLKGCPEEVYNFYCNDNQLTSLVGIHKLIKKINGGAIYASNNPITEGGIGLLLIDGLKKIDADHPAFDIINKYVSQGKMGILACQEELIENGYEEFAKL